MSVKVLTARAHFIFIVIMGSGKNYLSVAENEFPKKKDSIQKSVSEFFGFTCIVASVSSCGEK
jgi:hypothetical protein